MLIVEDEPLLAEGIRDGLRLEAIAADIAGDGDTALELLSVNSYDIAVLDRDIPGPSGDEIARSIVASGSGMPILMLTAADRLDDKASGFELGADDYLTKPFELAELVARLRALLRRTTRATPSVDHPITVGPLTVDLRGHRAHIDGRRIELTKREFDLLSVLAEHAGVVLSRAQLLRLVWGYDFAADTNVVDVFVTYLRKKLEVDGAPRVIHTVRGVGFVLRAER